MSSIFSNFLSLHFITDCSLNVANQEATCKKSMKAALYGCLQNKGKHRWEENGFTQGIGPRAVRLEHGLIDCQFHVSYRLPAIRLFLICRHLCFVPAQTSKPAKSSFFFFSFFPFLPTLPFSFSFFPSFLLPSFFLFFFFNATLWWWEVSSAVKLTFTLNGK